ncbi:hypothetical protein LTR66_012585 [Elasticomyces elasticus]|nr:hypothetical protein LTR66_012585 [Elasticomyces elasticus]
MKKLIPVFAVATRPAGIELLSRELNKPDFSEPCLRFLRSLLARAKLSNEAELRFPSPVEKLEEWYGSGVPPAVQGKIYIFTQLAGGKGLILG